MHNVSEINSFMAWKCMLEYHMDRILYAIYLDSVMIFIPTIKLLSIVCTAIPSYKLKDILLNFNLVIISVCTVYSYA